MTNKNARPLAALASLASLATLLASLAMASAGCSDTADSSPGADASRGDASADASPNPSSPDASRDGGATPDASDAGRPADAAAIDLCRWVLTDGGVETIPADHVGDFFLEFSLNAYAPDSIVDCRIAGFFGDSDPEVFNRRGTEWLRAFLACPDANFDAGVAGYALVPPEALASVSSKDFTALNAIMVTKGLGAKNDGQPYISTAVLGAAAAKLEALRATVVRSDAGTFTHADCPADGGPQGD